MQLELSPRQQQTIHRRCRHDPGGARAGGDRGPARLARGDVSPQLLERFPAARGRCRRCPGLPTRLRLAHGAGTPPAADRGGRGDPGPPVAGDGVPLVLRHRSGRAAHRPRGARPRGLERDPGLDPGAAAAAGRDSGSLRHQRADSRGRHPAAGNDHPGTAEPRRTRPSRRARRGPGSARGCRHHSGLGGRTDLLRLLHHRSPDRSRQQAGAAVSQGRYPRRRGVSGARIHLDPGRVLPRSADHRLPAGTPVRDRLQPGRP